MSTCHIWMDCKKKFKPINPSRYTISEMLIGLGPLFVLFLVPQYWLFQNRTLFVAFWIMMGFGAIIVRTGVCPKCGNINCALCPNKKS